MLKEYKNKRNFNKTTEPDYQTAQSKNAPVFVVQRHEASHLHFDFRLESEGVLKSWAIPKGPPIKPSEKHLAMMVEDHPVDYANFEGVIPKGNYGAGNVEIWDKGVFDISGSTDKKYIDEQIASGLVLGKITFNLHGQKLLGEFALVKLKKTKDKNAWLIIKAREPEFKHLQDKSTKNITLEDDPAPVFIAPMMATLIKDPFDDPNWYFEIKWDGYRTIAVINNGVVNLFSRNHKSYNEKFNEIASSLANLTGQYVIDGEIVALDNEGRPRFQSLQNYNQSEENQLYYYVFDLLYKDGLDLQQKPFYLRRELFEKIPLPQKIRLSSATRGSGKEFFKEIKKQGLEGMIAKEADSVYEAGKRSKKWLKVKTENEQEVIIGGFTAPKVGRAGFGSLLLGVYNNTNLEYIGSVGTGFDDYFLNRFRQQLELIKRDSSPFVNPPRRSNTTFVDPKFVCVIKFQEWTNEGIVRQPVFLGLKEDKKPMEVVREIPESK